MSNRTLIEINHDYCPEMQSQAFLGALVRYLRSADLEAAKALELYGVRVIAMRHHSGKFMIAGHPDGFPVDHYDAPELSRPSKDS